MIAMGILLGGHVRVGFEDNIYLRRGVLLKSNAEMVEVATPDEAREILGIT